VTWFKRVSLTILGLLIFSGILILVNAMQVSMQPIPGEWKKMFKAPAEELTEYAKEHPLMLKNTRIEGEDISESQFYGANFQNVEWNDVVAQEGLFDGAVFNGGVIFDTSFALSLLRNVEFENIKFGEASFSKGVLENVKFKDCVINSSSFVGAGLKNVIFENCRIDNSEIRNLQPSKVRIEDCELSDTNFFMSTLDVEIINSKGLQALDFLDLKPGSRVYIKNSSIGKYSDFSESKVSEFVVESSHLEKFSAHGLQARKLQIGNSDLELDFGQGTFETVDFDRSSHAILYETTSKSISITNCIPDSRIDLEKAKIGKLVVRDCKTSKIRLDKVVADEIVLVNVETKILNMAGAKIKNLKFQNILLKGDIDLRGAVADESVLNQVTIVPSADIKTEGTNIDLNGKTVSD